MNKMDYLNRLILVAPVIGLGGIAAKAGEAYAAAGFLLGLIAMVIILVQDSELFHARKEIAACHQREQERVDAELAETEALLAHGRATFEAAMGRTDSER